MPGRSFWIVIFLQLTALERLAQSSTTIPLEIYVYNQAQVPRAVLARAERRVTVVLRDSRVQPEWLDCLPLAGRPSACSGAGAAGSLAVQIVHGTTKMRDEIFGAAFLGEDGIGRQTDVFYDRLDELHRDWNIELAELLGDVMAHEIGHLLLGFHAHSLTGIMRPVWSSSDLWQAQRGALLFSPQQSKLIRQRLERLMMGTSERTRDGD